MFGNFLLIKLGRGERCRALDAESIVMYEKSYLKAARVDVEVLLVHNPDAV